MVFPKKYSFGLCVYEEFNPFLEGGRRHLPRIPSRKGWYFQKKYSFGLGVYEEFNPFLEGGRRHLPRIPSRKGWYFQKSIRSVWVYMRNSTPSWRGEEDICLGSRLERDGISKKSIRSVWVYMRNSTPSWRGAEDICLGSRLERDGISKKVFVRFGCISGIQPLLGGGRRHLPRIPSRKGWYFQKSICSVWVYMRNSTPSWRGAEDICLGSRLERDGISKKVFVRFGCI